MAGFFKIARGYRDMTVLHDNRPWRRPDAWSWMLEQADFTGANQGRLSVTVGTLATTWRWSRQAVYRFLENLDLANEISVLGRFSSQPENRTSPGQTPDNERTWTGRGMFVITICNYSQYSVADATHKPDTGHQPDINRTTSGHPYTESKKGRREEGEKEAREGTSPASPTPPAPRQGDLLPQAEVVAFKVPDEQLAFDAYNALAAKIDLRECRSFNPQRRNAMRARLRELGGIDGWAIALDRVSESQFIRDWRTDGWTAFGLHSLLQPITLAKLMDGAYNGKRQKSAKQEPAAMGEMRNHYREHHQESHYHDIGYTGTVKTK